MISSPWRDNSVWHHVCCVGGLGLSEKNTYFCIFLWAWKKIWFFMMGRVSQQNALIWRNMETERALSQPALPYVMSHFISVLITAFPSVLLSVSLPASASMAVSVTPSTLNCIISVIQGKLCTRHTVLRTKSRLLSFSHIDTVMFCSTTNLYKFPRFLYKSSRPFCQYIHTMKLNLPWAKSQTVRHSNSLILGYKARFAYKWADCCKREVTQRLKSSSYLFFNHF